MPKQIRIELQKHSKEVSDIIGRPPARIITFGNYIIAMIVLALFALSWVIKYPDVISGSIVLTFEKDSISEKYVGKMILPVIRAGIVKVGQNVYVKPHEFPIKEFGLIRGKISSVSELSIDTTFSVYVRLANDSDTTLSRRLGKKAFIHGNADIVTTEKRLLERIINF